MPHEASTKEVHPPSQQRDRAAEEVAGDDVAQVVHTEEDSTGHDQRPDQDRYADQYELEPPAAHRHQDEQDEGGDEHARSGRVAGGIRQAVFHGNGVLPFRPLAAESVLARGSNDVLHAGNAYEPRGQPEPAAPKLCERRRYEREP